MITFKKGLSYNFMIERIAESQGNYYYVIQVEHKECWVRMYPFEIYRGSKKNIIRCEYRGTDSYGSHIFIEDKLSILYELYEENGEYDFIYVKDCVDMEGKSFSVLKDKYGLVHSLYEPLTSEQKEKKKTIRCVVASFNQTNKTLILHLANSNNVNYSSIDYLDTKNTTFPKWVDAETLFKRIGKEHLLNEYFYNLLNKDFDSLHKNTCISLYRVQNNKWVYDYLLCLDRVYKYILIQNGDLEKLNEFADLMIGLLVHRSSGYQIKKSKLPKSSKYEGLKRAIDILQRGLLDDYHKKLSQVKELMSEMSTLLGLFEIDGHFFGKHFLLYKESTQMLYDGINQMDTSDSCHQSKQEKCLKALQGILSYRLKTERKRFIEDIIETYPCSTEIDKDYIFQQLNSLLMQTNHIDSQTVHSYIDMQPAILGEMACLIYGGKFLGNAEDSGNLIARINNMNCISTLCEEIKDAEKEKNIEEVEDIEDIVENEDEIVTDETVTDEANIFLNVYNDRTYIISENRAIGNNVLKSVAINPEKDKFILQCYENGSINKVTVRYLLEKKREKRYLNGYYPDSKLQEIFVVSGDTYLAVFSSYNQDTFIKLYSTKYISEHFSLGLKGNQVVGTRVDSTEYSLIPSEYVDLLPQRLIYDSVAPFGKNVKNSYYENDIQILKRIGIVKLWEFSNSFE